MKVTTKKTLLRILFGDFTRYLVKSCRHSSGIIYIFDIRDLEVRIKHMPITVVISKRVEKKAVNRNRLRRIVKAFIYAKLRQTAKYDKLFIVVKIRNLEFLSVFKMLFIKKCLESLDS